MMAIFTYVSMQFETMTNRQIWSERGNIVISNHFWIWNFCRRRRNKKSSTYDLRNWTLNIPMDNLKTVLSNCSGIWFTRRFWFLLLWWSTLFVHRKKTYIFLCVLFVYYYEIGQMKAFCITSFCESLNIIFVCVRADNDYVYHWNSIGETNDMMLLWNIPLNNYPFEEPLFNIFK